MLLSAAAKRLMKLLVVGVLIISPFVAIRTARVRPAVELSIGFVPVAIFDCAFIL